MTFIGTGLCRESRGEKPFRIAEKKGKCENEGEHEVLFKESVAWSLTGLGLEWRAVEKGDGGCAVWRRH